MGRVPLNLRRRSSIGLTNEHGLFLQMVSSWIQTLSNLYMTIIQSKIYAEFLNEKISSVFGHLPNFALYALCLDIDIQHNSSHYVNHYNLVWLICILRPPASPSRYAVVQDDEPTSFGIDSFLRKNVSTALLAQIRQNH